VLVGGVIDDEVHHDPDSRLLASSDQAVHVRHRAEIGVDRLIIGNVIAIVGVRRGNRRAKAKDADAEVL
jgi:hypothetical protein